MWVVRFSDKQLEVLKALLRSEEHLGPALSRALESLELARWDELPDAELPWGEVTQDAAEQGVSEADVVWDLCGRRARHRPDGKRPARPKGKRPARSKGRPAGGAAA
jgi:hypothetical protein